MMKNRIAFLLFILLFSNPNYCKAASQDDPVKKLYEDLAVKQGLEKAFVEAELAMHYFGYNLDSVFKYDSILGSYKKHYDSRSLEAYKYAIKAHIAKMQLKYDSSIIFNIKAYELFQEEEDVLQMGWAMSRMGEVHFLDGNYPASLGKVTNEYYECPIYTIKYQGFNSKCLRRSC